MTLTLSAVMVLLTFSGCGNESGKTGESESTNGSSGETETKKSPDTETSKTPDDPVDPVTDTGTPVIGTLYEYVDGHYVMTNKIAEIKGDTSTVQEGGHYSPGFLVHTDSVMSYVVSLDDKNPPLTTWQEHQDQVNVGIMIAINRGTKSYLDKGKDRYDDIQMDKDGNYIVHTANTAWYMVPSSKWNDYVVTNLDRLVKDYDLPFIVLEEPEMWHKSGYSAAFKTEWKAYFGTDWEDQSQSPEAWYRSMQLKTYLFRRLLDRIGKELGEKYPDLKIYIASHSTLSYNAWSITSGLDSYMSLGVLDGFIGQTWTDTILTHVLYNGKQQSMPYRSAYLEYASYLASQDGTDFYALADPMADNKSLSENDCRNAYLQTIAGMMMVPGIQRFEIMPWVSRAFAGVTNDYKTIQMNIQKMQKDLVGKDVVITAGTPGVAYAVSDSLSWITSGKNWAPNSSEGFYGITMPLVSAGIPVSFVSLDTDALEKQLKNVNVLFLTLDNILPSNEKNIRVLADWVRAGGTLLVVSGYSRYWEMDELWWEDYGSPLDALLYHLGLEDTVFDWGKVPASLNGEKLSSAYDQFTLSFLSLPEQASVLYESSDKPVGFKTKVGEGQFRMIGVSPANFAHIGNGSKYVLRFLEDAIDDMTKDLYYAESEIMMAQRGPYTILHAYRDTDLYGTYLDLFDPDLAIVEDPFIDADKSYIYYDVSSIDTSVPTLAFTGGKLESQSEGDRLTTFKISGPTATFVASRLFCRDGLYPESIKGTDHSGGEVFVDFDWNNQYDSLLILSDIPQGGVTYEISWSEKPVKDGSGYTLVEGSVTTTNANEDKDYLIENTANSNGSQRYCDLGGYLIYKFDISEWNQVMFYLSVSQNYILEVSSDKTNWTIAYDYSEGGKVPVLKNADNKTILTINPSDYGIEDVLYIRLRNAHPDLGWGGSVYLISWKYRIYD